MNITVKAVAVEQPAGKKFQTAEVIYADEAGATKTKKLVSFKNPAVYSTLKDARQGDVFSITSAKVGDYWEWTAAEKGGATAPVPSGKVSAPTTRSSYETAEERANRQVLIVKQNALTNAVAFISNGGVRATTEEVLTIAEQFKSWVLDNPQVKTEELDDIPF